MSFNCKHCKKDCAPEIRAQRILLGKCIDFEPYSREINTTIENIYEDIDSLNYLPKEEKQELKIKFMLETAKKQLKS